MTSFAIGALTARIADHGLLESRIVVSAAGRHDSSRFVTVALTDSEGYTGYGEAATTPLWSGETAETAKQMIDGPFAPRLVGASFDHPREIAAELDKLCLGNPFARGAVDVAAWDLWARRQGKAAALLFGDRTPRRWLPSRASVGCHDVAQTTRIAREFYEAGIRTLKFKIGVPGFDDVARLRAVRESLGSAVRFTVDANSAYATTEGAVAAIEALLPFELDLVEQPTPRHRISLLAAVRRRVNVPIMADECVFTADHLREAIDLGACDIVSLYPGKNGGVTQVIEMSEIAAAAGIGCAIGSNLETELGQGAMIALAAALKAFPADEIACDLAGSLYYKKSAIVNPLPMENGGVTVPGGAGFGVEPIGEA